MARRTRQHTALAQVEVLRHDTSTAAEQYAALKPYPNAVTLTGAICTDRLLGLLANTMSNLNMALGHFEDALAFCHKAGYRPELAWTRYDYAKCLMDRNSSGDRDKAASLLDDALSISTELGMKPLTEKSSLLKEQVEAVDSPQSAPKYPKGLTEREVEVLWLVAQGRTNGESSASAILGVKRIFSLRWRRPQGMT